MTGPVGSASPPWPPQAAKPAVRRSMSQRERNTFFATRNSYVQVFAHATMQTRLRLYALLRLPAAFAQYRYEPIAVGRCNPMVQRALRRGHLYAGLVEGFVEAGV